MRFLRCAAPAARLPRRWKRTRRPAAIVMAAALATGWLVRAAYADSNPAATSGPGAPSSGESTATEPAQSTPTGGGAATSSAAGPFGYLSPSWQGQNLLGDMWGLRPALGKYGVTLGILENVETFGNLTGGVQTRLRSERSHDRDAANGHPESVRSERRHVQRQRPPDLGRQSQREQSAGPGRPSPTSRSPSAFDFGSFGISRNSATSSTSRSASRASTRNSSSARAPNSFFINGVSGLPALPSASICPAADPPIPLRAWAFAEGRS